MSQGLCFVAPPSSSSSSSLLHKSASYSSILHCRVHGISQSLNSQYNKVLARSHSPSPDVSGSGSTNITFTSSNKGVLDWFVKGGPLGLLVKGWNLRVDADPQFPFKVLMEELVGVSACVLGDMASRPSFGLKELDFVFCTLVVGSIMNFVLMYLLAPTSASSALCEKLPGLFASCPASHMFEPGSYALAQRLGTFVYKGLVFGAVGLLAGLMGTAISNALIGLRKKMDPNFETPNKPPPPLLNAVTWALHMGLSSNFRYQTLNGIEFVLQKAVSPIIFKSSVIVLRCLNNVLGGMSFVCLARLTGSQKVEQPAAIEEDGKAKSN